MGQIIKGLILGQLNNLGSEFFCEKKKFELAFIREVRSELLLVDYFVMVSLFL
jgi:hypothetical protein